MVNKSKILSDISKMAVEAMDSFSGIRKEVETVVGLKVNKIINKMNLVKRDEFEVLKKLVQNLILENKELNLGIKKKKKKVIKSQNLKKI